MTMQLRNHSMHGVCNFCLLDGVHKIKLYPVWDSDSRDWKDPPADEMTKKMVSGVQNGSITLFHVGKKNTVQALPEIIAQLKGKGYIFKTVGEIIYYDNFNIDVQGRQYKQ